MPGKRPTTHLLDATLAHLPESRPQWNSCPHTADPNTEPTPLRQPFYLGLSTSR